VPGIGEKTAAKLVAEHGSLAALLAAKDVPPAIARRLAAAGEYLAAARRVVLPVADVPLPAVSLALPARPAHPRTLARLAAEHELKTPVKRVEDALSGRPGSG
jgi:5'-3' exonuclease